MVVSVSEPILLVVEAPVLPVVPVDSAEISAASVAEAIAPVAPVVSLPEPVLLVLSPVTLLVNTNLSIVVPPVLSLRYADKPAIWLKLFSTKVTSRDVLIAPLGNITLYACCVSQ